jgi:hypothetical protein
LNYCGFLPHRLQCSYPETLLKLRPHIFLYWQRCSPLEPRSCHASFRELRGGSGEGVYWPCWRIEYRKLFSCDLGQDPGHQNWTSVVFSVLSDKFKDVAAFRHK